MEPFLGFVRSKYFKLFILVEALAVVVMIFEWGESDPVKSISRRDYGGGEKKEEMLVSRGDSWEEIELSVSEKELESERARKLIETAKKELLDTCFGNNPDNEHVWSDLVVKEAYAEDMVDAVWEFEPSEYINPEGRIDRDLVKEPENVTGRVTLSIGDEREEMEVRFRIFPPSPDTPEGFLHQLSQKIKELDEGGGDELVLPDDISGESLTWKKKETKRGPAIAFFGIIAALGVVAGQREDEKRRKKERKQELSRDYPDILSKLSLYIGAGFSAKKSFENIVASYLKDVETGRKEKSAGYESVCKLVRSMADGIGEMDAYRAFAVETEHKDYRKLVMLLTQNIRKGSRELTQRLDEEESNAFEERKARAKVAGEEASTKLLLPMMGLLLVVMLALIVPALMNMEI